MQPLKIKPLAAPTLRLSEPINIKELEGVLVALANKVNEVVEQTNKISEYLRK
jgi:hypothetical protein